MNEGLRKIVLVGDTDTKLNFICEFLDEVTRVLLKEKCTNVKPVVEVVRSNGIADEITYNQKEKFISVLSAILPYGIKFSCDLSESDWIKCKNAQTADLILFVEAYPFTTDYLLNRLLRINEFLTDKISSNSLNNIQFRALFIKDNNQHFGATDVVDIHEALKNAPDNIIKRLDKEAYQNVPSISALLDFKVYEDINNLADIVSCNFKILGTLSTTGTKKYEQWCDMLEYFSEDYWLAYNRQFNISLRFEEIHNKVNRFGAVRGSKDILKKYADNYQSQCFDEVIKIAVEQYKQYISNICFWDIDKDIQTLKKKLKKLCSDKLISAEKLPCPEFQAAYQKIITEQKIDITFSNKIGQLERTDVPNFVYDYLKKKEEILSKVF